jgi:hypothetical protein
MNLTILLSDQTPDDVVMSFAVHLVRKAIVGNQLLEMADCSNVEKTALLELIVKFLIQITFVYIFLNNYELKGCLKQQVKILLRMKFVPIFFFYYFSQKFCSGHYYSINLLEARRMKNVILKL